MKNIDIVKMMEEIFLSTEGNKVYISELDKTVTLFDLPFAGFADAEDPVFDTFKKEEIIGPRYMTPKEWMEEAGSVVTWVFPFSEEVRESARKVSGGPSIEWLYGRVEGHAFMQKCMRIMAEELKKRGLLCCIPTDDERYARYPREYEQGGKMNRHIEIVWSERHAGFAAGLGTFGLSRCLITERGTAHRMISCILNTGLKATPRKYRGYMEYCTRCGACIKRCPVEAISQEYSKNNILCGDWNNLLKERNYPRYGCSCCMTAVPCEQGIPDRE